MIRPKYLIVSVDICLAYLCLAGAHMLSIGSLTCADDLLLGGVFKVICYLCVIVFTTNLFELYDIQKINGRKFLFYRVTSVCFSSFFILSAIFYIFPMFQIGRGLLIVCLLLFLCAQLISRCLIQKFSYSAQFATRIMIVGTGELAKLVADIVPPDNNVHSFIRFVTCSDIKPVVDPDLIVGCIDDIDNLMHDYRPQKLIIALSERRGKLPLREFMRSKLRGVEIIEAATYFEQEKGCLLVENMQPSAFVYTQGFRMTPFMRSYKRIYDIIFSTVGLLITAPIFPILAMLIKRDSPGPVFYKQLRVGENEVEYFVYKFRTMSQDAEKNTGAVWAQKNDPRVTKVGQFLRKTRLDEIPQLYNVLKGDMSFIGPRPERMAFVERLKETIPFYSIRHFVKPGVTGWAQVCYPYGASDEDALEKMRYDLFYIKNYSVLLDFRIIIDTIRVVLTGFGGR
ncbi:MAG: TIGR03013 family PEP-CTERM/XrtA system glycosyltransferase [Desulfuromonadales bacterium]|nr:TIGR03013 family PEP-CTERM/XrtA system glycosyltransferase [Desulfuromonadales bacterium]